MTDVTEADIKRIALETWREQSRLWFAMLYGDCPELKALQTMATVERKTGRITTRPLAWRMNIANATAWRWLKRWVEGGWVQPMLSRSGHKRRVIGWLLTEKARFALMLSAMI